MKVTRKSMRVIAATGWPVDKLDKSLEKMREHAMQFPERQISRPVPSIWHLKTKRQETIDEAELMENFARRDALGVMMAQSFSLDEMPTAVLHALLNVLETNGIDRLAAIANIAVIVEFLRKFTENEASLPEQKL